MPLHKSENLTALWLSPDEWMIYSNRKSKVEINEYEIEKLLHKDFQS